MKWVLVFGLALLVSCNSDVADLSSLTSITVKLPDDSSYPKGAKTEDLKTITVWLESEANSNFRECDGKLISNVYPYKGGGATLDLSVFQNCNTIIQVYFGPNEFDAYLSGGVRIKSTNIKGKQSYPVAILMQSTALGAENGFMESIVLLPKPQETNIDLTFEISNSLVNVSPYFQVSEKIDDIRDQIVFTNLTVERTFEVDPMFHTECQVFYNVVVKSANGDSVVFDNVAGASILENQLTGLAKGEFYLSPGESFLETKLAKVFCYANKQEATPASE